MINKRIIGMVLCILVIMVTISTANANEINEKETKLFQIPALVVGHITNLKEPPNSMYFSFQAISVYKRGHFYFNEEISIRKPFYGSLSSRFICGVYMHKLSSMPDY